ncbi:MAG: UDP-N-acetylmuramate dehydrogenase [Acidobacteria bacterium]|nr:UDP-N-acetylmuramate dehydrogenase [Acidobacteriota bacterium]
MSIDRLVLAAGGLIEEHSALGARTTYRVGGSARAFLTLETRRQLDELGPLIFDCGLPVVVLGNGSNLLVADGEHEILVVRLRGEFCELTWQDGNVDGGVTVHAGAGLDLPVAARRLSNEGIVGFEWAVGVPGTFGGAVVMNAGGHGSDMAASVVEVSSLNQRGAREWTREQLDFSYRSSAVGEGELVTRVTLALNRGDAHDAGERLKEIVRWRREHQPGGANAGSVFHNPDGDFAGRLIDAAGCRGLRVGSAVVSEKHANFIQVDPGGRADDVYQLMRIVRERVAGASGVQLRSEHRFIGFEVSL